MMQLNVPTLLVVMLVVNMTLGCFCFTCWYGRRDRQIYYWICFGSAASVAGSLLLMLRGSAPDWMGIWLAQTLLQLAFGCLWMGVRVFEGRKPRLTFVFAGAVLWTIFSLLPAYKDDAFRIVFNSGLMTCYFILIALDLISGYKREPGRSRVLACVFACIHVLAGMSRVSLIYDGPSINWPSATNSNLIGFFVIEALVSLIGLVLSLTTMERDRAEREQRKAASTDVLTGALNRRAFIDNASDWIERRGKDAALILFDLDHFKKINDTFGHAGGDAALIAFAQLVSRRTEIANIIAAFNTDAATSNQYPRWYEATLADAAEGGEPLFGRLGGEEFACLLPHLSLPQGLAIAEDIRRELEALVLTIGGLQIAMTVSASVVTTSDIGHRLDMMLSSADHALYRAKHKGRNRVEVGFDEPGLQIRQYG